MSFWDVFKDQGWEKHYKFYCPTCKEEVILHMHNEIDDETFECPTCTGIMLRSEDEPNSKPDELS